MTGCERIRKLLSQLTEAHVTIENLTDSGDMSFTLRRDELLSICASPLQEMQDMIKNALTAAGEGTTVSAVEIVGGGMRMQVVQQALLDVIGQDVTIGAKFDDGSAALGCAILANNMTKPSDSVNADMNGQSASQPEVTSTQEAISTDNGPENHSDDNMDVIQPLDESVAMEVTTPPLLFTRYVH